jgi:photosystem II stability/assembly factor-like uncharacterized protein
LRAIRLAVVLVLTLLAAAPGLAAPRWTQDTPFGGDVLAVAQAPSAPRLLYALSVFGQVFASRDGGATWGLRGGESIYPAHDVELAVSPAEPETVYMVAPGYWLSRSRDGGRHWDQGIGGWSLGFAGLAIDPDDPDMLYVATIRGLYRSRDGGENWEVAAFEDLYVSTVVADPRHPAMYFALVPGPAVESAWAVWRSSDHGETWTQISSLAPKQTLFDPRFVFDPSQPYALYLGGGYGPVLRSGDGGVSWTELPGTSGIQSLAVTSGGTLAATVQGRLGISRSTDRGETWEPPLEDAPTAGAGTPKDVLQQVTAASFPSGTLFALGYEGFWKSTDAGTTWRSANQGLVARSFPSILVPPGSSDVVATTSFDEVFRSADQGATWSQAHAFSEGESPWVLTAADPHRPGVLYGVGGFLDDDPLQSTDGGRTWTPFILPGECSSSWCNRTLTAFLPDPGAPDTLYVAGTHFDGISQFLVRTSNGGATWEFLPPLWLLQRLLILPGPKSSLVAGTCQGLYKKDKAKGRWRRTGRGLPPVSCRGQHSWTALAADPHNPRRLYAAGGVPGVFVSDDEGETFRAMSHGLEAAWVQTILVDPENPYHLYAAAGQGYFQWNAGQRTWAPFNQGLPIPSGSGVLALDPQHPSRLYTATSQGIYRIDLSAEP